MDITSDPDTSGDEVFSDVDSEEQDEMDEEEMDDEPHVNGDGGQHAPKRRKLAGRTAREALHGIGDGIDHAEDAEASLLDLEVRELLEEAAVGDDDAVPLTAGDLGRQKLAAVARQVFLGGNE